MAHHFRLTPRAAAAATTLLLATAAGAPARQDNHTAGRSLAPMDEVGDLVEELCTGVYGVGSCPSGQPGAPPA